MKKLLFSAFVLALAGIGFFVSAQLGRSEEAGTMRIIVIDEQDDIIVDDMVSFDEGDHMVGILTEHYMVQCGDGSYHPTDCANLPSFGRVLVSFEEVETDWWNTFIALYINDEYSNQGIDDIEPQDGAEYRFEYTEVGEQS